MHTRILVPALLATTALGLSACGKDKTAASTATPTPAAAADTPAASSPTSTQSSAAFDASSGTVTVKATEFAFGPSLINAKAGKLKITLENDGKAEHELVVLKTDAAPGDLKVSNGRVSEKDSVGEVSDVAAGTTKSHTFNLKPGKYVFVCNVPGHYMQGMRGELIVS